MSKPYHEMNATERLGDRIAKNHKIERKLAAGRVGLSLDGIVAKLDRGTQRATYGAVAQLVGALPRGLMSGRRKSFQDSWIVAATTSQDSRRGWPTGYTENQIHSECLRQIYEGGDSIIEDGQVLRKWLDLSN
jgi:hypothetical protein